MSDPSKKSKIEVEDLSFDDLDGGKEGKGLPPPMPTEPDVKVGKPEETTQAKGSDVFNKNMIFLPITKKDGSWEMKLLDDVSGDEFINWVMEVLPVPTSMVPRSEDFDGPGK